MPVQRFAAMNKDFATFDCDAHVTEPPLIWERAAEYLTREEMQSLRSTIWWDEESRQLIVNGRAGVGIGSPRRGGIPGTMRVISNAGPGVKHDIQRALNVRNLKAGTALTQEQVGYIDFAGSYEPEPRLRDMDVQGIDQVMIIPTDIDTYPWLLDAVGAKAFCKAYNQWAYEYTKADPTVCSSPRFCQCRTRNLRCRRYIAWLRKAAELRWCVRPMRWGTIRCSRSTNRSGTHWKRPAWCMGCIRFPPAAR